jgi:osmotically-inducible protein OsmY
MDRVRDEAQPRHVRRLAEEIEGIVQRRTGGQIRGLHVEVDQDRVIITGRAATYYAKQLAQHAAMDAAGHECLTNEIEVY